jgi:hypothetical protein
MPKIPEQGSSLRGQTLLQRSGQYPFCENCLKLPVIAEDRPAALREHGPTPVVADDTKVLQRPMQDGERREIRFVENLIHGIQDFRFIPGPLKFMCCPFDTFPMKSTQGLRQRDAAVLLDIAEKLHAIGGKWATRQFILMKSRRQKHRGGERGWAEHGKG